MAVNVIGRAGVVCAVIALATVVAAAVSRSQTQSAGPAYDADGRMLFPKDYRTWVYLSSGMDMSYVAGGMDMGGSVFDNVFVDPAAYAAFQATGTWPDKTVLVLEARRGQQNGSINKRGKFQTDVMGVEVHVKDTARFKGGWAFFGFDGQGPGQLAPPSAPCYACHEQHAAVDTTFVQFYPTLLPIAKTHMTLSPNYLADEAAAAKPKPVTAAGS